MSMENYKKPIQAEWLMVPQPSEQPQAVEILDKGKGNMKWEMEEGSCKYQLWKGKQLCKKQKNKKTYIW